MSLEGYFVYYGEKARKFSGTVAFKVITVRTKVGH